MRCSNRQKGCKWIGELGSLKGHLYAEEGCGHVLVACPNACRRQRWKKIMRKDLQRHLKAECQKRPYQCEHCDEKGTFIQITGEHYQCCPNFPLDCPNKCGVVKIKRIKVDQHRKICPLEAVDCPFGCSAVGLQRKDEAEHMEKNIVNHQLLMLKSWNQKVAVIAKNIDSLLVTCTDEQRLPLQSIRSVIDDSYFLKVDGPSLSLQITNFSKYKQSNGVWYSPPFYLGDVTGLKLRLAVYPNGIKAGAGTHVSLVIECLERDVKEPKDMQCGSYVEVSVIDSGVKACSYSHDICKCKNSREIWLDAAAKGGFHCDYWFITHDFAKKSNDTLELQTKLDWECPCDCACHQLQDKELY